MPRREQEADVRGSVEQSGAPRKNWAADPDWQFRIPAEIGPEQLRQRYRDACDRSRAVVEEATGLEQFSAKPVRGTHFSLRWVLLHLIEETARHVGHADLLREAIDGSVG